MRRLLTLWLIMATVGMLAMVGNLAAESQEDPPAGEEPSADEDRITFKVPLSAASGGGLVEGWAGDFEYQEGDYLLATGGIRLKYRDLELQADEMRIDIASNVMTAQGSVVLDEGPRRLVGETLEYDLTTRTGRISDATAYVDEGYVFKGDEIAKIGATTYTVDDGLFTSCIQEDPPWSLHMSRAKITVDDYARFKNARMKFGKVPVFYLPYMVWPTKTDRSSGFLVPQPGYSSRRGFELGMAYFKTLGRSADTTFFLDLSTEEYFGVGNEFRYNTGKSEGYFEFYLQQDQDFRRIQDLLSAVDELGMPLITEDNLPDGFRLGDLPEETRWKTNWFHETKDFWGGFRGVINFRDYSDPSYRQDFERAVRRQTNNFIYSEAYLTRNFGQQSFNIKVDLRERFRTGALNDPVFNTEVGRDARRLGRISDTRRQLPEIEYRLRPTQLGGAPIYFSLDANAHYLSIENSRYSRDAKNLEAEEYGRLDLFPNFSMPLSTLSWLSAKLDLGGRATYYTNSIDLQTVTRTNANFHTSDEALTRTFGVAGLEVVGPSFSRIFEKKKPGRFSKFKHIVEPRIDYSFVDDFENPITEIRTDAEGNETPLLDPDGFEFLQEDKVPLFDEIDNRRLRNEATVSIINRILAKPTNEEEEGGAFEILSFEISQAFSQGDQTLQVGLTDPSDPTSALRRTKEGPIRTILRYNPSQETSFKTEARYNTINSEFQSISLSGGFKIGRQGFGGSLIKNWNPRENIVTSEQLRVFTSLSLIPDRLTFDANVSFDLNLPESSATDMRSNPLQQRYFLNYTGSCYSMQFEYRESTFGSIKDTDFRFMFTLKNVGTFIDMNGSL